jgi:hypothetical protein
MKKHYLNSGLLHPPSIKATTYNALRVIYTRSNRMMDKWDGHKDLLD